MQKEFCSALSNLSRGWCAARCAHKHGLELLKGLSRMCNRDWNVIGCHAPPLWKLWALIIQGLWRNLCALWKALHVGDSPGAAPSRAQGASPHPKLSKPCADTALNGTIRACGALCRISEPLRFDCALWGFPAATAPRLVQIYHRSGTRGGRWSPSGGWGAGAFLRSPNQRGRRTGAATLGAVTVGAVTTSSAVPSPVRRQAPPRPGAEGLRRVWRLRRRRAMPPPPGRARPSRAAPAPSPQ